MELRLKNSLVIPLANWLHKQLIHGNQSRARTRFIKLISDRVEEIEKTRLELLEKYSATNEKGEKVYLDKDNKDTTDVNVRAAYKIGDIPGFNKEYGDYLAEELVLDITAQTKETINGVKDILLNTNWAFSNELPMVEGKPDQTALLAHTYDEICQAFENIPKTLNEVLNN